MKTYKVMQYDAGETKVEAEFFEIQSGSLIFFVKEEDDSTRIVAAFQSWISVVETKLRGVS